MSTPLGPYSPIVRAGDFLIVSGQGGMAEGALVEGGVAGQTRQALANVAALLGGEGASLQHVVKTTCFLTDMDDFATFNGAYVDVMGDHRPARSTVAVRELPGGFSVEIEAWAHVPAEG
jgi:2-iminobutanoate/2-iminopropanoate deaminase